MATAAAVAWYLFSYIKTVGFGTIPEVMGALYVLVILEGFVAGLALFLLFRGLEIAARLKGRGAPPSTERTKTQAELEQLARVGEHTFYYTFRYLLRAAALGVPLAGVLLSLAGSQGTRILGGALLLLGAALHTPGLFGERPGSIALRLRGLLRSLGMWWVEPARIRPGRSRYRILSIVGSLMLFGFNAASTFEAELTSDAAVYAISDGNPVILRYNQGGLRGHRDSETEWSISSDPEAAITFHRLAVNEHIAVIPISELEEGVHHVSANMRVVESYGDGGRLTAQAGGNRSWEMRGAGAEVRFLIVP